uniref:Uncharacterized protein n=1 Tax=Eucampia antarctica TaxID=49252 RepID=A0A7S2R7V8_9STRA
MVETAQYSSFHVVSKPRNIFDALGVFRGHFSTSTNLVLAWAFLTITVDASLPPFAFATGTEVFVMWFSKDLPVSDSVSLLPSSFSNEGFWDENWRRFLM